MDPAELKFYKFVMDFFNGLVYNLYVVMFNGGITMKMLKRIFAAALAGALALTFTACHKKDEIAVTVGDVEFTSAYYMCALINADSEAKTKVQEGLSDEEKSSSEIDYYSKKIDDKPYVEWVEDTAMNNLKKIAAYKTLCKENKLELDEEDKTNAENYASMYWSSYGYGAYFEPNGVSQKTYTRYMTDAYYSGVYFEHIYGAEGEKAIAADKVKAEIYDNFIIANILEVSFGNKSEDEIKTLKEKLNGYVTSLKDGSKTFEEVYKDYNGTAEEEEEPDKTDSEEPQPKDKYASILGAEDTVYEYEHYEDIKKMANGEVKLIELEDNAGMILAVKRDITADPYYLDTLDITARHLIADDEFEKEIEEYAGKLKLEVNNYAVKQFKVKKIKEPELTA